MKLVFYRIQGDHSLATKQLAGRNMTNDNERLAVAICCNEDGLGKISFMDIGKYAKPCFFKNVNRNNLNCQYHANTKSMGN